jgi:hypothetical protein
MIKEFLSEVFTQEKWKPVLKKICSASFIIVKNVKQVKYSTAGERITMV